MNKRNNFRSGIAGIVLSAGMVGGVQALPTGFALESGDASYSGNTLQFNAPNSVVQFDTFNIANAEALSVNPGGTCAASCVGLARVQGAASALDGTLNLGMNFILMNQNGIVFGNGFTLNSGAVANSAMQTAFVATTYDVNFSAGQWEFSRSSATNGIQVNGLTASQNNSQVLLVSDKISVEGDVNLPGGIFSAASGGTVRVSLAGNNLLEFDITSALDSSAFEEIIGVRSSASIAAGEINLSAFVDDPLTLAVNNQGVMTATGIGVNDAGKIQLLGHGGFVGTRGSLDTAANPSGQIELAGREVFLDGEVDAGDTGSVGIEIGRSGSGTEDNEQLGRLEVSKFFNIRSANMSIEGYGGRNQVDGLANYVVSGMNSGTAGFKGVGSTTYENTGAIQFSGVSWLTARTGMEHDIRILSGGTLFDNYQGDIDGRIEGADRNDRFLIEGSVEKLFGNRGADDFVLNGGVVEQLVDGGQELVTQGDRLIDVLGPQVDPLLAKAGGSAAFNSSPNQVARWINIESVTEFIPPAPAPVTPVNPNPGIIAPQISFLNLSDVSSSALGLVGDDANPRLPCGFRTELPAAGEKTAAEEDCLENYNTPEYQSLLSSIIHFDNDSADITLASARRLDKVSAFVVESELFETVRISGHTDSNASDSYNMALSERRANSTSAYMQSRGVSADLIETQFFGERLPAVPNTSPENLATNRRAVIELER